MSRPEPALGLREHAQIRVAHAILGLPEGVARRIAREPIVADGDPLDPRIQLLFALKRRARGKNFEDLGPLRARQEYRVIARHVLPRAEASPGRIEDAEISGIRVRIYRGPARGLAPALAYFHGGGFAIGDLDTHDPLCRFLCRTTGATVIAVDYRLAPEHRWPACFEDCEAVTRWLRQHGHELDIDPARVAIAGDSAGGQIAAVISQRIDGLALQALVYPGAHRSGDTASKRLFGRGFGLDQTTRDWFISLTGAGPEDEVVSPLLSKTLDRSPRTYLCVAGFDPLRDEGLAYASALQRAGVVTSVRHHTTLVHGFVHMTRLAPARAALDELAGAIRAALGRA